MNRRGFITALGAAAAAATIAPERLTAQPRKVRSPRQADTSPDALAERLERDIPALVNRLIEEGELPGGFSIAVVRDRAIIYHGAFGRADREADAPMTSEAIFPIGSVTKTFTAALAVKLAARGLIDLDASVLPYLPDSVSMHPSLVSGPVTLRKLLTHRQGWPRDHATRRNLALGLANDFDPSIADPASFSRAEFYNGLAQTRALSAPRLTWNYSNLGFHFAAHVLELVTGKEMQELVGAELAAPLGLVDTSFRLSPSQRARVPAGYVFDARHDAFLRVPAWTAGEIVGASFLSSTARDLARYLITLIDPAASATLLGGEQYQAALLRPYVDFLGGDVPRQQALAWQLTIFGRYGPIIHHSGDADGHNAYVALSRPHRLGLVLLTNNDNETNEVLATRLLFTLFQGEQ